MHRVVVQAVRRVLLGLVVPARCVKAGRFRPPVGHQSWRP